ncbi:hypothetical protein H0H81_010281 [Sphagnurus paluster]|uniref:Uncharacterized protein n=1 Tax=Sphagnurus paluster TaxID=117069 RepID=A0A9P7GPF0_9AGAR|nr:hypothetical protein H0H81_010281 [Sphagnurus paluster]
MSLPTSPKTDGVAVENGELGSCTAAVYPIRSAEKIREFSEMARAHASYSASVISQLREDPVYLRKEVETRISRGIDLLPDIDENCLELASLLSNPRYVAQKTRAVIFTGLVELALWSLISLNLDEAKKVDESATPYLTPEQRQPPLNAAVHLAFIALTSMKTTLVNAIILNEGWDLRRFFRRAELFDPDRGIGDDGTFAFQLHGDLYDLGMSADLRGACIRWAVKSNTSDIAVLASIQWDLSCAFSQASQEELSCVDEFLLDRLSTFKDFCDFWGLCDMNQPGLLDAVQLHTLDGGRSQIRRILRKAAFEKRIKSIESLIEAPVFKAIWKEIDALAKKSGGKTLEQIVGYAPTAAPRWKVSTPNPSPRTKPLPLSSPRRSQPLRTSGNDNYIQPPPAKIKPYYKPGTSSAEPSTHLRHKPKVKSRPQSEPSAHISPRDEGTEVVAPLLEEEGAQERATPLFWVSKEVYDTFEKMFCGGRIKGLVTCEEFEKTSRYVEGTLSSAPPTYRKEVE